MLSFFLIALYRFAIRQYQTRISPHKGYRCAYSLQHGGPGCSGAVLKILEEHGLIRGWGPIKERFAGCSESADRREKQRRKDKSKKRKCGGDCMDDVACCAMDMPTLPSCHRLPCDGPCDLTLLRLAFRLKL